MLDIEKLLENNKVNKDILNSFLEWSSWIVYYKNYSIHTLDNYSRDVLNFFSFIADYREEIVTLELIEKLTHLDFRSWIANKKSSGTCNNSNARALSSIRNFLNYLKIHKDIENDANMQISVKNDNNKIIKCITINDIENILCKISHKYSWIASRNRAIIMLMYGCGMRISEVLRLKVREVQFDSIHVLGKGGKERSVHLYSKIKQYIDSYIKDSPYHDLSNLKKILFVGIRGNPLTRNSFAADFVNIRRSVGLPESITPHSFRYSFATHLLNEGVDIRSLQEMLGHSDITTTERYTRVDKSDIINAISFKHPRNNK
ncbi:tyrosine-type recombinase/integrase [Anaplasmataceae bacterium AB001_6]|nr:tyrosine-type recombinase/integrase [Anaplasmataceae bacterium AB001_6]